MYDWLPKQDKLILYTSFNLVPLSDDDDDGIGNSKDFTIYRAGEEEQEEIDVYISTTRWKKKEAAAPLMQYC